MELAPVLLGSFEPRTLQRSHPVRTRTTSYLGHRTSGTERSSSLVFLPGGAGFRRSSTGSAVAAAALWQPFGASCGTAVFLGASSRNTTFGDKGRCFEKQCFFRFPTNPLAPWRHLKHGGGRRSQGALGLATEEPLSGDTCLIPHWDTG